MLPSFEGASSAKLVRRGAASTSASDTTSPITIVPGAPARRPRAERPGPGVEVPAPGVSILAPGGEQDRGGGRRRQPALRRGRPAGSSREAHRTTTVRDCGAGVSSTERRPTPHDPDYDERRREAAVGHRGCRPGPGRPRRSATPGTTSHGMPAAARASASSPPRPRRRDRRPSASPRSPRRAADHEPVDRFLVHRGAASALADREALGVWREVESLLRHEARRRAGGGLRERADRADGQESGLPGPAPPARPCPTTTEPSRLMRAATQGAALCVEAVQGLEQQRAAPAHRHALGLLALAWSGAARRPTSPPRPESPPRGPRAAVPPGGGPPSVGTAIVIPPRRKTPPCRALAGAGSSAAFTQSTPGSSAAAAAARFTSGGAAATTSHAPSRIGRRRHARGRSRQRPRSRRAPPAPPP